jgi:hypothetical protein
MTITCYFLPSSVSPDYVAEVPIQRFYTWTLPPGYPVKKMHEHLELFATQVMPHFR